MQFYEILTNWYSIHKRELPWRDTKNPYYIWLSEIILQQTQVHQGLPYYKAFVKQFPSIYDLANATEDEVLKLWQGLGYYSRARNLHFTAKYVVEHYNGEFPTAYNQLITLKGVGDYTASAIASICNDEACAVVDGNVYRVLARHFGIQTPINTTTGQKQFKTLAQSLLPQSKIGDYNQAIMEFGANQCKPKSPDCMSCVLNSTCVAYSKDLVKLLPQKLRKQTIKKRYLNYLVFVSNDNRTILRKRTAKGIWMNLYEFPCIESNTNLGRASLLNHDDFKNKLHSNEYEIYLHNKKVIIHKLSHQHLYSKFWIVRVERLPQEGIPLNKLKDFAVPQLIHNFISDYNFD